MRRTRVKKCNILFSLLFIFTLFLVWSGSIEKTYAYTPKSAVTVSAPGVLVETKVSPSISAAKKRGFYSGKPLTLLSETIGDDGYVWYLDKNSFVDTPIVRSEITYYFEQDSIIDGINFYIEGMKFEKGIEYYNLNVPIDLSKFEKVTLTYQVYTKRNGYRFVEGQGYLLSKVNFNIE